MTILVLPNCRAGDSIAYLREQGYDDMDITGYNPPLYLIRVVERHGNHNVQKMPRRKHQFHPDPPSAA